MRASSSFLGVAPWIWSIIITAFFFWCPLKVNSCSKGDTLFVQANKKLRSTMKKKQCPKNPTDDKNPLTGTCLTRIFQGDRCTNSWVRTPFRDTLTPFIWEYLEFLRNQNFRLFDSSFLSFLTCFCFKCDDCHPGHPSPFAISLSLNIPIFEGQMVKQNFVLHSPIQLFFPLFHYQCRHRH